MSADSTVLDAPTTTLHQEAIAQYHRDGFVVLRSLFEAGQVAVLQAEAERLMGRTDLMDSDNIRCRWQNHAETGECRFDCFDPVIDLSPVCEKIARDPRLLDAISALYGEQAHLFKDKLIFKPPGALGYAMHQDYISWPSFPTSFVTAIVAIDPAGAANGATEVFPGYHQRGCLSPMDGMYHELTAEQVDPTRGVFLELEPGDVAVFSGYTPHRSSVNASNDWRRLLYLSYNANSDGGERREAHYAEFKTWLQDRYADYGKVNTFFR
ncbi:MAG: phytanoyl-CoA dioxygenase family protein [Verrucomicrobium sp.]|nr:phytanoyl-CoA dioxygenase family protein [Verrucomicrobium sp.]